MPDEQRRYAERITLKEPIIAMIGDMEARLIEISLIGGRIEHVGRLNMGSAVTLTFRWQGENIKLKAKIARTQMSSIGGKMGYSSGVDFAKSAAESPVILQRIVASFIEPESIPLPSRRRRLHPRRLRLRRPQSPNPRRLRQHPRGDNPSRRSPRHSCLRSMKTRSRKSALTRKFCLMSSAPGSKNSG